MKLILPVLMMLLGGAVGAGAGLYFGGVPAISCEAGATDCEDDAEDAEKDDATEAGAEAERDYLRLKSQFVVPVVRDERIGALVVMSLSLETEPGYEDSVYAREPKLRDALLRVLFDHAHMGGFDGLFTESGRMTILRVALLEAAREAVGDGITDILITDIARQER